MSKVRLLNNWASRQFSVDEKSRKNWNWKKYKAWLIKNGTRKIDTDRMEGLAEFASKQIKVLAKEAKQK